MKSRASNLQSPISNLQITAPDHRLDIDGTDDVIEEIARLYGYANIPDSRMNDELPPQHTNVDLEQEEQVRDLLIDAGMQDVITYALTTPEREALLSLDAAQTALPARAYVRIENPISAERAVMRQSLISNLLDLTAANLRYRTRVAMFEIGLVYWTRSTDEKLLPREIANVLPEDADRALPLERRRLAIALTGARDEMAWQGADNAPADFYDLKGIVEALLAGLHINDAQFVPANNPLYHPGRAAMLKIGDAEIGAFGELHPLVRERFDLPARAVLIGEFDLDAMLAHVQALYKTRSLARYPAVAQDLAIVVDENVAAERVHTLIAQTGGALLARATLFDVYRGDQIARGKKSLAYALTFQSDERTLTDDDATKLRGKIVQRLQRELGAQTRGA